MKLTRKFVKDCIASAPIALDGADIRALPTKFLGTYQPKDANWCYEVHAIAHEGMPLIVASRFGRICAEGTSN